MKTETFRISHNELIAFQDACEEITNVNYVSSILITHYSYEVIVEYKWEHDLFYLGQMLQLKKQRNDL